MIGAEAGGGSWVSRPIGSAVEGLARRTPP
jgi:hypothetical protein